MLHRILNTWRPAGFHYHHALSGSDNVFEGWYLKCVDSQGRQPLAFIPGVFLGKDPHAFIQVLDGAQGRSWYLRYEVSEFQASTDGFDVSIGPNRFSSHGLHLDIAAPDSSPPLVLHGSLEWGAWNPWPITFFKPGCMGPYAFVPRMECNHGILSLDHAISGTLHFNGSDVSYDGGRGYVEKDWGRSFPAAYVWVQSNHFDQSGICLTASVAKIPWWSGTFRGFLAAFLIDGTLHPFTTYGGGRIRSLEITETHLHLRLENRSHALEVNAEKAGGALLKAPYEKTMLERVAETMTSTVEVCFSERGAAKPSYVGVGKHACMELQGALRDILGHD